MHIRDIIQPIANQYVATIDLDRGNDHPVSPVEEEKIRQFGQLRVNIGGTLSPEEGDDLVLGNRYMYLPRDFPLQQVFSIDDHGTLAAEYAQLWVDLVKTNLSTALETLLAKTATAIETVTQLPD